MLATEPPLTCLTYCGLPYAGVGWPQSCVSILAGFAATPMRATLVLPRSRSPLPPQVKGRFVLPPHLAALPWRLVAQGSRARLESRFTQLLDAADPTSTVAYFWPGASRTLIEHARACGILTAREMINTAQVTAKPALDSAYEKAGLPATHTITAAAIEEENRELPLYDLVFASNGPCEASLRAAGVQPDRIAPTSFGWSPDRCGPEPQAGRTSGKPKFLFVGSISVRKGVPTLLAALRHMTVAAELTLVGKVEPALAAMIGEAKTRGAVRVLPFTHDVGALYRSHDVFVFPTVEEGGPQVTIEAGGCGLPVITTPMGAARLVKHDVNGLVVPSGAVKPLAAAMDMLAADPRLRQRFARRIRLDAQAFTYTKLGAQRALILINALERRHREVAHYA